MISLIYINSYWDYLWFKIISDRSQISSSVYKTSLLGNHNLIKKHNPVSNWLANQTNHNETSNVSSLLQISIGEQLYRAALFIMTEWTHAHWCYAVR